MRRARAWHGGAQVDRKNLCAEKHRGLDARPERVICLTGDTHESGPSVGWHGGDAPSELIFL